jgi:hypothetical protein
MTQATSGPMRMLALAVTLAWSGCSVRAQDAPLKPLDDPEAYTVYASLLPNEWPVRTANAETLVFEQETGTRRDCMPSGKPLEAEWRPVVDDFRAENASVRMVRPGFALGRPYIVVPKADIEARLRENPRDPWPAFYMRYPDSGGFMVVSAVGFNASKDRAMVYMSHECNLLCGGGRYHLLEKVDGAWRAANLPTVWNCAWVS